MINIRLLKGFFVCLVLALCLIPPVIAHAQRWDFVSTTEGWTGRNASVSSVDGNLYVDPDGSDPGTVSPSLSLSASSYGLVKMHMSSNCPDTNGQIYFITSSSPSYDELKSVTFSVSCGSGWCTYEVDMTGNSYWTGTITGLRIDPADNGIGAGSSDIVGFDWIEITSLPPPPAPTLSSPSNGSITQDETPYFSWSYSGSVDYFHIQIAVTSSFNVSDIVREETQLSSPNYTPLPMTPNTYYWRVRSHGTNGTWSDWSSTYSFTIQAPPPSPPTLTSPSNGATLNDSTPDLFWSQSGSVSYFHVQIATDSNFTNKICDDNPVYTTNYTPGDQYCHSLSDDTYWWRVRSYYGSWSEWSSTWNFTISTSTPPPTLTSPIDGATLNDSTPDLVWTQNSGSVNYFYVQIATDSNFNSIVVDEPSWGTYNYTPSPLADGTYWWRVKSHGTNGIWSNWASRSFTISTVIAGPELLSPSNNSIVNTSDITFQWSSVSGAVSYEILVDNNSGFGSPEINRTGLAETNLTLTNPFPDNTYYWKVRAKFPDGTYTDWSTPWPFTYNLPVHSAPVWVPLYRLYHSTVKDHYYTTIPSHRDDYVNINGYTFEKVEAYISDRKFDDPNCGYLLHLWDKVNNIHFYTSDETEKDNKIIAGYSYEGIVGFLYTSPTSGTAPLHHLEKAADTDNFYTVSQFEYDNAINTYGFTDMGIVGYVSPFAVPNNRPQGNFSGIDTATGAFHPPAFTDLSLKGLGPDMSFIRYYNSYNFLSVPLGSGWSHSLYNYILEVSNSSDVDVVVKWGDGTASYFVNDGADNFTGILGSFDALVKYIDAMNDGYNLTTKSQTIYEFRRITVNTAPGSQFIPEVVLTAIEDKHGNRMQFEYTAAIGLLYRVTDASGRIFDLKYNASNQLIKVTDNSLSRFIEFTYDTNGNLATFKDARGNITNYGYNSDQLLDTITFPESNTVSITYDNNEPLRRVIGYTNGNTQLSFDYTNTNSTNSTTISNPTGPIVKFTHDNDVRADTIEFLSDGTYVNPNYLTGNKLNLVDEVVDRKGIRTTYTYDSRGNVLTVTKAPDTLNQTTTYTYDTNNNLLTIQEPAPRSNVTTFTYSPDMKNLMSVVRQEGGITSFTYYANGLVNTVTDPNSHMITYTDDSYGNPLQITDNSLGTHVDFTHDNAGRLLTKTDELLKTTIYTYDPNDNLTQIENADNKLTIMNYDMNNRLTSITDPRNKLTSYTYNNMNLLESETNPVSKTYQYGYDSNGNVSTVTDPDGNVTEYVYDQISNRLTEIKYNTVTKVSFTQYDSNGNLEQISYDGVTTNVTYDDLNRISSYTDRYGNTVQYEYDVSGNRTKIIYPGSKDVNYVYDGDNRLSTVTDWLGGVTSYNYDNAGLITSISNPNSTTVSYSYDAANRLTGLSNRKSDTTFISDYTFTLNDVGNPSQVIKNEPLIPTINAANVSYAYDNANRITTAGIVTYTHDNRGNLTGSSSGNVYNFDYADRLSQITVGGQTIQYTYDGFGNRIARTNGGVQTRYILDLNGDMSNVLADTDSNGNVTNYYVYGHGLISKITSAGQRYIYHYDNIGNTIAITDSSENITDKYAYHEFGKALSVSETNPNLFRYVGKFGVMDEGNGLLFMRTRYYDVDNGRFISKDPIGFEGGDWNLYAYVGENPVTVIDPKGSSYIRLGSGLLKTLSGKIRGDAIVRNGLKIYRIARGRTGGSWRIKPTLDLGKIGKSFITGFVRNKIFDFYYKYFEGEKGEKAPLPYRIIPYVSNLFAGVHSANREDEGQCNLSQIPNTISNQQEREAELNHCLLLEIIKMNQN